MEPVYRGVKYVYLKESARVGNVVCKYRGLDWRFRNRIRPLVMQPNLDLMHRAA